MTSTLPIATLCLLSNRSTMASEATLLGNLSSWELCGVVIEEVGCLWWCVVVCGGLLWFLVVCCGLWWLMLVEVVVVVCDGLFWFVVV